MSGFWKAEFLRFMHRHGANVEQQVLAMIDDDLSERLQEQMITLERERAENGEPTGIFNVDVYQILYELLIEDIENGHTVDEELLLTVQKLNMPPKLEFQELQRNLYLVTDEYGEQHLLDEIPPSRDKDE